MRALTVVLVVLAAAPLAHAGGWATVELSSTPDAVAPGQTWEVDVSVLQHGRTPLAGVEPVVIVTNGSQRLATDAEPTGRTGVYRAAVEFPRAGTWRYVVDDGFGRRHTFPPVEIGAAAPAAADGGGVAWGALLGAAGAGLLAAALLLGLQRRRTPRVPA